MRVFEWQRDAMAVYRCREIGAEIALNLTNGTWSLKMPGGQVEQFEALAAAKTAAQMRHEHCRWGAA